MNKLKYLALLFLLCVGGKAFAQSLGMTYGYPTIPVIHSAGGAGGSAATATLAPPSPVASATYSATGTGTFTLPNAAATPGNITLIAAVNGNSSGSTALPNFCQTVNNPLPFGGSGPQTQLFLCSNISTSMTINPGVGNLVDVCAVVYSGAWNTSDATTTGTSNNNTTAAVIPSVTTQTANALAIGLMGTGQINVNPVVFTKRCQVLWSAGTHDGVWLGDHLQVAPGATPTDNATLNANGYASLTIALPPGKY